VKKISSIASRLTLREKVADFLRDEICANRLKAGEKITETVFSRYLGVSRTPIREAFYQLEAEGFLTIKPHQGVKVAQFRIEDIINYYEVRKVLEGYAARQTAMLATSKEIGQLKQLNRRFLHLAKNGCHQGMNLVQAHDNFHIHIVRLGGNPRMLEIYKNLGQRCRRYRFMASVKIDIEEISRDHDMIIAALKRGNANAAEKAVHINAERGLRALLKTRPCQLNDMAGLTA